MTIRRAAFQIAIALLMAFLCTARAEVRIGDSPDDVFQAMGAPKSRATVGDVEVMQFKDGTKVLLRKGYVTEITTKGQMHIGKAPAVIEPTARREEPKRPPPPAFMTKVAAPQTQSVALAQSPTKAVPLAATNTAPAVAAANKAKPTPAPPAKLTQIQKIKKFIAGFILIIVGVSVALHVLFSFCFKRICENSKQDAGVLVWIPIAQFIPLLRLVKLREWMLVFFLIPVVNYGFLIFLGAKLCVLRKKSPWLAATLALPVTNLFLFPYLAFSGEGGKAEEKSEDSTELESDTEPDGESDSDTDEEADLEENSEDELASDSETESDAEEEFSQPGKADVAAHKIEGPTEPVHAEATPAPTDDPLDTPFAEMPDPTATDEAPAKEPSHVH